MGKENPGAEVVAPSQVKASGQQVRTPRPKGNGKFQSNSRSISVKGAGGEYVSERIV